MMISGNLDVLILVLRPMRGGTDIEFLSGSFGDVGNPSPRRVTPEDDTEVAMDLGGTSAADALPLASTTIRSLS